MRHGFGADLKLDVPLRILIYSAKPQRNSQSFRKRDRDCSFHNIPNSCYLRCRTVRTVEKPNRQGQSISFQNRILKQKLNSLERIGLSIFPNFCDLPGPIKARGI